MKIGLLILGQEYCPLARKYNHDETMKFPFSNVSLRIKHFSPSFTRLSYIFT